MAEIRREIVGESGSDDCEWVGLLGKGNGSGMGSYKKMLKKEKGSSTIFVW